MKKKSDLNILTLLLLSFSASALADSTVTTQFDALTQDGSGNSTVNAMTPDGQFFVGFADTDTPNQYHAVRWDSNGVKVDLDINNGFNSSATGISNDGKSIIYNQDFSNGVFLAYVWNGGTENLITDFDGFGNYIKAMAISGNGNYVVGSAASKTEKHAFVYDVVNSTPSNPIKQDLGTLKSDNSGNSIANAITSDGQFIVGSAEVDNNDQHAVLFSMLPQDNVDLGTLRIKDAGNSSAEAISDDGKFIVGFSDTDTGETHAARWVESANHNYKIENLGTLKTGNTGDSKANAISADGSSVAGYADNDNGEKRAVRWSWDKSNALQKDDLGTLKANGSGNSEANAISADGSVVIGYADNDKNEKRAVIWKITTPTPSPSPSPGPSPTPGPTPGPTPSPGPAPSPASKIVDVRNSQLAMLDSAAKGMRALSLYQGAISGLSDTRCQLGADTYCVGAFSQFDHTQHNSMTTSGLFGAIRLLPSEKLIAGASVNFSDPTNLVSGYNTKGSSKPGVGIFTRWQDNPDGSGLTVDLSGAFIQNNTSIRREQLSFTEAGVGTAQIKGWQTKGTVSWGIKVGDATLISPVAALSWQGVSRSAYTENRDAEFVARYGKMENKALSLNTGLKISHKAFNKVTLNGSIGTNTILSRERKAFTGSINYIGAYAYNNGEKSEFQPYANAGISVKLTSNSTVDVNAGWQKTDYRNSGVQAAIGYSYHW